MIRLFVEVPLASGEAVTATPEQARYLAAVMRLSVGDPVLLFNGRDGEWRAVLTEAGKRGARLAPVERTREQALGPDLDLVVALVKRGRLETIVEKAAELGARRVRLAVTRRTNADHTNVARLQAIVTEGAEQTGRLDVPEVVAPEKLDRLLDGWDPERRLMFCDEGSAFLAPLDGEGQPARSAGRVGDAPLAGEGEPPPALGALSAANGERWGVLVGPEGGFDPAERERLRALPFVTPVSLGPRILRADTAAISALTLWQAALGDWR